jgi:Tol biopolymer transport system component
MRYLPHSAHREPGRRSALVLALVAAVTIVIAVAPGRAAAVADDERAMPDASAATEAAATGDRASDPAPAAKQRKQQRKPQRPPLPLEPARTIEFETSEATWLSLDLAPDGTTLVMEILGDLYLLPADGGEARMLTRGMAFDSQPRFSPDGVRIAFVSDRDGAENVWVIGVDGKGARKLSDNTRNAEFASPSWAPDGSHVVVSRTTWGLAAYELWAYHLEGGKGVRLTRAKATPQTSSGQRGNSLGAVYAPDGRHLYYAYKSGGFSYNVQFPQWQIVRHDLRSGARDRITQAQGSAFRPLLSPDGTLLVYGTRYEQGTGLRIRNLSTGADRWLVYPVEHDDQESRFTRDLLPGYAFTPDGSAVIVPRNGGLHRVDVASGRVTEVPFTAKVRKELGPRLYSPYRLGLGPVKARLIRDPTLSPDGRRLAFSAFTRVHVFDFASGEIRTVSPEGVSAFHPAWAPDGRSIAYVSWNTRGGHIWRTRADGRGTPKLLTPLPAFYTDPTFTPDGRRLVALRASSYERLYRENDFGSPVGSDVIWLPADGGDPRLVMPSRGYARPHFGPDDDRIYLYQMESGSSGLVSVRFDGTDRRELVSANGPGIFFAEEDVPADDVRISPDGRHVLISHANQLYLAALINPHLERLAIDLARAPVPLARLTDVGADFFGWDSAGQIYWSAGAAFYQRPLDSVRYEEGDADGAEDDDPPVVEEPVSGSPGGKRGHGRGASGGGQPEDGTGQQPEENGTIRGEQGDRPVKEAHRAVRVTEIPVYLPRHVPQGTIALVGATVIPMTDQQTLIESAVVVVENDRIAAVGPMGEVEIPAAATRLDVSGRYLLPGYVDTHAHFRPLRRVLDTDNWGFMANLAYGVTTGLDPQPSTPDILAYQDLIDAGLMIGPRALSTGPGIFSNNDFASAEHTRAVLRRYKDNYRLHNLKSYLAGNRKQRQWIVEAARGLALMPTTEGALDMKLDLTHVLDGFSGNEHNFPLRSLYQDVVELVARSGIAYTPALLVGYGGPFGESYFYTRESPHRDPKLRRFTPANVIASRTLRGPWFLDDEYAFPAFAAQAAKIARAGGRVGVGSHGQLQGLGYHWELWALASGMTNWEALTAATRHGAEMIGVAADIGTVEAGKLADLVLLTANPLKDIRNSSRIEYVMKNGELYDADNLDQLWPVEKALPTQWWWNDQPVDAVPDIAR